MQGIQAQRGRVRWSYYEDPYFAWPARARVPCALMAWQSNWPAKQHGALSGNWQQQKRKRLK